MNDEERWVRVDLNVGGEEEHPVVIGWLISLSAALDGHLVLTDEQKAKLKREIDDITFDWFFLDEPDLEWLRKKLGVNGGRGRPPSRRKRHRDFFIALAYEYRRASGEKESAAMGATMIEFSCSEDTVKRALKAVGWSVERAQAPPLAGEDRLAWFNRAAGSNALIF